VSCQKPITKRKKKRRRGADEPGSSEKRATVEKEVTDGR
jgi:hypothetical protein